MTANLLGYPYSTVSIDPRMPADSLLANPTLLLRYFQLSIALPVTVINFAPWAANDPAIAAQCKTAFAQRALSQSYYNQLIQESIRTGEPIVRHMEYEFPRNGFTDCNDQFMIGSKYLVAPLTRSEQQPYGTLPARHLDLSEGRTHQRPCCQTFHLGAG